MYNNNPETAACLARDWPNIMGIKDFNGNMTTCWEYLRAVVAEMDLM